MSRRPSKRIDLIPDFMGPDSDPTDHPALLGLKLEIAIRKGLCRAYPFSTEVRDEVADLLKTEISASTWMKFTVVTVRYMLRVSQYNLALRTATVRTVCQELVRAIDQLVQTYERHAAD